MTRRNPQTSLRYASEKRGREIGYENLTDLELLISLLLPTHPHIDVSPIAKSLLDKFKTLPTILKSSDIDISQTPDITQTALMVIKILRASVNRANNGIHIHAQQTKFTSIGDVLKWFRTNELKDKGLYVMGLDGRLNLLACSKIAISTTNQGEFKSNILKNAILNGVTNIIIINKKEIDTAPNRDDIDLGQYIKSAGQEISITLHDYLIINDTGHFSLYHMI